MVLMTAGILSGDGEEGAQEGAEEEVTEGEAGGQEAAAEAKAKVEAGGLSC